MEGIGQKKETDYIFDKTIKCDVCGKEFKTKQVRTGKARFIGTDDILKPLYEGIDTCKYDIIIHIFVILFLHLIDVQLNCKIIILEQSEF